ncbi:hypothetical protein EYC59_03430 [Candidatus Saccharibacteria bacterium]|nr:MAG: hypothetical protein EYC59_03430 [Candidatus Saccharibacteria bacterium]
MNQLSNAQEVSPQSFALPGIEPVAQASEAMPYEPGWFARSKVGRTVGAFLAASLLTGCAAATASQSDTDPATVGIATGTTSSAKPFEFSAQPTPSTTPNTTPAPTTPSTTASAEQPATASTFEPVSRPEGSNKFEMALVKGGIAGTFYMVSSQEVASGSFFELPEPPGCPWTERSQVDAALVSRDIPEGCDWSETSRWISNEQYNATYPTSPMKEKAKTYIGRHYCIKHIFCPGDEESVIPDGDSDPSNDKYPVSTEDQYQIKVLDKNDIPVGEETYQICGLGSSPKHPKPGERSVMPTCEGPQGPQDPDLVVATCIYDTDDATGESVSTRNTIIVARMVSSRILVPPQG